MATPRYLTASELRLKMQMAPGFMGLQRMLVIYTSLVDPRSPQEIARHTGLSEATVNRIIAEYNEIGVESLDASKTAFRAGSQRPRRAN